MAKEWGLPLRRPAPAGLKIGLVSEVKLRIRESIEIARERIFNRYSSNNPKKKKIPERRTQLSHELKIEGSRRGKH